ncbi:hypothetical protein [Acidipila rosea]|uniref:DUF2607 family protein n=1 Tax=Acidipila rosea TaxID=768535 RepID=A0A4R1L1A7_9BACT|nr:hypothetical protein [Acidipila rosea]MBW4027456.1 hypothetical protein [Acidobacteriota bacterium]MBW4045635.1 hypothetical protein [Acidobacteriota bacterium]TCK71722.1 hypothetical protein C7378_3012 [Acidipila rosea]
MSSILNWPGMPRRRIIRVLAFGCVLLLLFASTLQVVHSHETPTQQDHCQLCMAIHSAMPARSSAAVVAIAYSTRFVIPRIATAPVRFWEWSLSNRPPPSLA